MKPPSCANAHQRQPGDLSVWAIYASPADYPGKHVLREWFVRRGYREPIPAFTCQVADSLAAVRALLPPGVVPLHRLPDDDPCLVESWL